MKLLKRDKRTALILMFMVVIIVFILLLNALHIFLDKMIEYDVDFTSYSYCLDKEFDDILKETERISNLSFFKELLKENKSDNDSKRYNELKMDCYKVMNDYLSDGGIIGIYIFDESNNIIYSQENDDYYKKALAYIDENGLNDDYKLSDFLFDEYNERYYIFSYSPVKDDDITIGAVLLAYSMDVFSNLMYYGGINESSSYTFMLSDGSLPMGYNYMDGEFAEKLKSFDFKDILLIKSNSIDFSNNKSGNFKINAGKENLIIYYNFYKYDNLIMLYIMENDNSEYLKKLSFDFLLFFVFFIIAVILIIKFINIRKRELKAYTESITLKSSGLNGYWFSKTGIDEIDMVINEVETLINSENKPMYELERIFEIIGIDAGYFEVRQDEGVIICSTRLIGALGYNIEEEKDVITKIPIDVFYKERENTVKCHFENEKNIFCINKNNTKRWIKFIDDCYNNKMKGFVVDVSKKIIEKYGSDYDDKRDYITGMLTREAFIEKLTIGINNYSFGCGIFAVFDLSSYNYIEEVYGKDNANKYIKETSKLFSMFDNEVIAAYKEGSEFLVFIYSTDSRADLKQSLYKWHNDYCKKLTYETPDGKKYKIRFTIGYCLYPNDADNVNMLMKYSTYALYESKRMYRESIHAFSLENYNRDIFLEVRKEAFDKLIDQNELNFYFQPIISLSDGSIYGYEALMRPDNTIFSSPMDVIDIAISEKKEYVLEKLVVLSCLKIVRKNKDLFKSKRFFYNSLGKQTLSEEDVQSMKIEYSDIGHLLIVELSEDENVNEIDIMNKCKRMNEDNSKVAIDKYGGKFISDDTLLMMHPNYIKLDRSLITDISLRKEKQSRISKIVKYAREHNIMVIAVGIETRDELYTIIRLGVDFAQGFYLALPKPNFELNINSDIKKEILEINML